MHFQIKGADLLRQVNLVERAVATNDTIPALTGIKLTVEENNLTLTANNLEIAIETKTDCTVFESGENIVDGRLFAELVRKLPNETVILQAKDNQVKISAETMEFSLNTLSTEDFPEYPSCSEHILSITDNELQNLIKNSSFATSNEDHQPIFSGVLLEIEEETFQFVATDSNRLSYVIGKTGEKGSLHVQNKQMIIPKSSLLELERSLPMTEDLVEVYFGEDQLAFRFNNTVFTTRLIDGKFPNYRSVLYQDQKTRFIVKRRQFIQALERASLFARKEKIPVMIQVANGILEIGTISALGKASEQYNVEQTGDDEQAAYSPKYILDMLKIMEGEDVEFRFEGSRQALIKPATSDDHLYILMPIRI